MTSRDDGAPLPVARCVRAAVGGMVAALTVAACKGAPPAAPTVVVPVQVPDAQAAWPPPTEPSVADNTPRPRACCRTKNECKGLSGCRGDDHDCRGKNECKGLGTSCAPEVEEDD